MYLEPCRRANKNPTLSKVWGLLEKDLVFLYIKGPVPVAARSKA